MTRSTLSEVPNRLRRAMQCSLGAIGLLGFTSQAHASLFSGETLDTVANVLAWIVLFVAPIIAIAVFWIIHILPERIAEKRHHPQAPAIKTLCLLSLFFGGMLWPFAWLWAYSKPVLHKIAYGTDAVHPEGEPSPTSETSTEPGDPQAPPTMHEVRERPRAAS